MNQEQTNESKVNKLNPGINLELYHRHLLFSFIFRKPEQAIFSFLSKIEKVLDVFTSKVIYGTNY